jgi:hypothetical protein
VIRETVMKAGDSTALSSPNRSPKRMNCCTAVPTRRRPAASGSASAPPKRRSVHDLASRSTPRPSSATPSQKKNQATTSMAYPIRV